MKNIISNLVRNIAIASAASVIAASMVIVVVPMASNATSSVVTIAHAYMEGFEPCGCEDDYDYEYEDEDDYEYEYEPPTPYTPPTPKAPTCTMTVNKSVIEKGESVLLSWTSKNATSATVQGVSKPVQGGWNVSPNTTYTYSGTFKGTNGQSVTCSATITVKSVPPAPKAPTCTMTASKSTITKGETVLLSWTSANATSAIVNGVSKPVAGGWNVSPNTTHTYSGTFTGTNGQTVTCSKTITVTVPPPTPVAPTCTMTASKSTITKGETVLLSWTSKNATSAIVNGVSKPTAGGWNVSPNSTHTYSGTFYGANGQTVTCSKTITVTVPPPTPNAPTCTMTASKDVITQGETVLLSWTSTNATSAIVNGVSKAVQDGMYVAPNSTHTYSGTFYGANGQSVTCSKTITVTTVPPTTPGPSCTIIINNYNNHYFAPNQGVTISWNSYNANSGWINNNVGAVTLNGSRTVYPSQTTTYTATFAGQNGQTVHCSVTVYINSYVPPTPTTPYITLSSVPYTGLELGPMGTILYWSFLVLWALFAAYLVAVKRVQNRIYASFKSFLFGDDEEAPVVAAHQEVTSRGLFSTADLEVIANTLRAVIEGPQNTHGAAHAAHAPAAPKADVIDEFVLSQINRTRRG